MTLPDPANRIEEYLKHNAAGASRSGFQELFVPGRVEVFGKHTDYAGGSSLVGALSRGLQFFFRSRADDKVLYHAVDTRDCVDIGASSTFISEPGHWSVYPRQVVDRIAHNFPGCRMGAEILVAGSLPRASGMSSSSALVVGTFLCLSELGEIAEHSDFQSAATSVLDFADYLSSVENGGDYKGLAGLTGVGTLGGSEDHTAILASEEATLGWFRYRPTIELRKIEFPEDYNLVFAASGVTAEKTGSARDEYNRAARACHRIVDVFNRATGARARHLFAVVKDPDFDHDHVRSLLDAENDGGYLQCRLEHFLAEELGLLPNAVLALQSADFTALGETMFESHGLADRLLGNQTGETNFLVSSARQLGATGASAFGAGFGGSVYALVHSSKADTFMDSWHESYEQAYPTIANGAQFFIDRPRAGVDLSGMGYRFRQA